MIQKIKDYALMAVVLILIGTITYFVATYTVVKVKYLEELEHQIEKDSSLISELNAKVVKQDSVIGSLKDENALYSSNIGKMQQVFIDLKRENTILADKMDKIEKNGNVRYFVKSFWSKKYEEVFEKPK